VNVKAHQRIEL